MQCCLVETSSDSLAAVHLSSKPLVRLQSEDELANLFRKRGLQPLSNTSLWACLGRLVNYKDGTPVSHDSLAANTGFFMVAGYETTAHLITWALLELAADPPLQVTCNAGHSYVHAYMPANMHAYIHITVHSIPYMSSWICRQACGLLLLHVGGKVRGGGS